jgi:hypothetical protein
MTEYPQPIGRLLDDVRARRTRLDVCRTATRAALALAVALAVLLLLGRAVGPMTWAVAALAAAGLLAIGAAAVVLVRAAHRRPSDAQIARYIEEQKPELDERLVSAVGLTRQGPDAPPPVFADAMLGDASRRAASIDPADIVAAHDLRRAGFQLAATLLVLLGVIAVGRHQVRRSFDALALSLFPSKIHLDVTPGNARVQVGSTLNVRARLAGNDAPVLAQLLREQTPDSEDWRPLDMAKEGDGFTLALPGLTQSFRYRVVAAGVTSDTFNVAVLRAPRVTRIDLDYVYPQALGLQPRSETDTGDIYAPAGTEVKLSVHTDAPIATGELKLANADTLRLAGDSTGRLLSGTLTVSEDSSYRVALADRDGMTNRGDTEYFIRILNDRPPEVHVTKPASDRRVTPLEEVDIEAEADDDFGIASLELVYSVAGAHEKVVPLRIPARSTSVSGAHTIYLEDLDVRPGDFVSYYVRARDLAQGKRSSEARSDLFFLEIKPFEEEFTLAQSQAASGGGASNPEIDDLVTAQKQVIVATWKLDRRAQTSGGKSNDDVKAVATAETELKARVEQTASSFGTSRMRTPRRPTTPGGRGLPPIPPAPGTARAGQTLAEEDALSAAAIAMGEAVTHLNALRTTEAVTPEMEALNQLLRAQADVKRRQVQMQQAGAGNGNNRPGQDLSSLFDKELARQQQTNYETPNRASNGEQDQKENALDKIKDLAQRQDELTRQQQRLAQDQSITAEERARELQKLLRDQNELRQQAEQLARQMARQQQGQSSSPNQSGQQQGSQSQSGQQQGSQSASSQSQSGQSPSGQQGNTGQRGQSGEPRPSQSGQQGQSGPTARSREPGSQQGNGTQSSGSADSRELQRISEEMRNAAGELGKANAEEASERSARALDQLRQLQRRLEGSTADGQRRALGNLQLEARQLAEAQRRIADESARTPSGDAGKDAMRRLAGEQQRVAERLERVEQGLEQQAQARGQSVAGKSGDASQQMRQAAGDSAQEINRQRLGERMQQAAEAFRAAAQNGVPQGNSASGRGAPGDIARALDRIADRLSAATKGTDEESRKLTDDLARVQELRDRIDRISKTLDQLNQPESAAARGQQTPGTEPGSQPGATPGREGQPPNASGQPASRPDGSQSAQSCGGTSGDAASADLKAQAEREMREARDLLDKLQQQNEAVGRAGVGRTFAGQGMVLSAPGTEGFKQDFARWQELSRQLTSALDQAETSIAGKLRDKEAKDRLAAGADDRAPPEYQQQVDSYFRALAAQKKP